GLIGDAERIARVAVAAYDMASLPATAPSGTASYDNGDGTRTVIGPQAGGRTIATHVGDLTPPGRPLGVAGASSAGVVYIAWGGELDGGVPEDFDHVSLYMSVEGASELVGTLTEAGIVSTVPMATAAAVEVWATAEDDACLADGTQGHNVSEESDRATVTVAQAADPAAVTDLLGRVTALSRTKMLMATCDTDAATAAKAATLASGSLDLSAGASVTVVFAHANMADAPTLDVGGTGARPLRTNGAASAYWADGQAVVLTYDGTYWQVCSTPVYASTVTVGNPGGSNVRIDSNSVDVRDGTDVLSSFGKDKIRLGGTSSASLDMLDGSLLVDVEKVHPPIAGGSQYTINQVRLTSPSAVEVDNSSVLQIAGRSTDGEVGSGLQMMFTTSGENGSLLTDTFLDGPLNVSGKVYAADLSIGGLSVSQAAHKSNWSSNLNDVDYGVNTFTPATTGRPIDSYGYCITVSSGNGGTYSYWRHQVAIVNGSGIYTRECVNPGAGASWTSWRRMTYYDHAVTPIYRLYNQYTGMHHWVTSKSEYNSLVSAGWTGEGIAYYAFN
ncbi:MAG: hypothetical protein MR874_05400, partial [Coriobacteriaceae bacterium]|nr:hypothetical protein [Coriobacteriaceae bacterium]